MSIHPRHWCVMGNLEQLTDNIWLPGYMEKLKHYICLHKGLNDQECEHVMNEFQFYGNLPLGKKCRMFGISRNNVAESQANMAKINGIRSIIPPLSVKKWLEYAMTVLTKYFRKVKEMWNKKIPYTSIAISAYENNSSRLKFLNIEKIDHSVSVDVITISELCNEKIHERRCVVDNSNYTQCSCTYFQQYGTLCSHLMKCYIYLKHLGQVNAMTFEKWSQNIMPSYMKICNVHQRIEKSKMTYDYATDMYDFKNKCCHSTDMKPPPTYKKSTSFTHQKRFKSKGESYGGNTQPVSNVSTKANKVTFAGKQTMARYLNKKQMEEYSHLSKKGFFHIMNADRLDEMKKTINATTKTDDNIKHRECSYCKSILHNGHAHNIRTCQKALNQGKSNFMDYKNGIFMLLHIKGINQNILDNEFSIFAVGHNRNQVSVEQCTDTQPDEILNVRNHNIPLSTNEIENKKDSMITNKRKETTLTKNESNKRSKTTTKLHHKKQKMTPVTTSVKKSNLNHQKLTKEVNIPLSTNEIENKKGSMITNKRKETTLTKNESNKRSKTTTKLHHKKQKMTPVTTSVKKSNLNHQKLTKEVNIQFDKEIEENRSTLESQLKMIRWGIKANNPYLEYINTCAVDSILFSIYYLVNKFPKAMEYIQKYCSGLNESINFIKNGNVDMARVTMINSKDQFNNYRNNPPIIDATSSIGDWLYYMKNLVKFEVLTNVTCTSCNKYNNKTKVLLSIDMVSITKDLQSEVTKRSEENIIRDCCAADEIIDVAAGNG